MRPYQPRVIPAPAYLSFQVKLGILDYALHTLNQIQRKWVYLEPIFGMGALPAEQGRFRRVEEEFRDIMAKVRPRFPRADVTTRCGPGRSSGCLRRLFIVDVLHCITRLPRNRSRWTRGCSLWRTSSCFRISGDSSGPPWTSLRGTPRSWGREGDFVEMLAFVVPRKVRVKSKALEPPQEGKS